MRTSIYLLLVLSFTVTACTDYGQDAYREQIVVTSYLTATEPFSELTLYRTAPINDVYDAASLAVLGANVTIHELDAAGNTASVIAYQMTNPGIYRSVDGAATVKPSTRYRLDITVPGLDNPITATTFVPDTFSVRTLNSTSLPYQGPEQFEANLSPSVYPGRQTYYVITTAALDTSQGLVPFYEEFSEEDDDVTLVSSGIINQMNYEPQADGSINLKFPWLAVAYYGPNEISFYAIDDNVYDFVRSAGVQLGGSTTSPGEIENVLSSVNGAIGVFGSMSVAKTTITVEVQ